jgi:hypothetical protein
LCARTTVAIALHAPAFTALSQFFFSPTSAPASTAAAIACVPRPAPSSGKGLAEQRRLENAAGKTRALTQIQTLLKCPYGMPSCNRKSTAGLILELREQEPSGTQSKYAGVSIVGWLSDGQRICSVPRLVAETKSTIRRRWRRSTEHLRGSCPSIVKACAVLREFQQSNGYEPGAKAVRGAQMQRLIDVAGLAGICWIAYDVLAEDEVWSVPTGIRSARQLQLVSWASTTQGRSQI